MSTIEVWNHPPYEKTSGWHNQEISILNDKILAVGLVDYTGNNTTQINSILDFDMSVEKTNLEVNICNLYYKFPVGDDSIQVADVAGESYKTIVIESYSSTKSYMRIRVLMSKLDNTTTLYKLSSSNYHLSFAVSFSKDATFVGSEIETKMYGFSPYPSSSSSLYKTSMINSFVCNTGDSFHLSFLHVTQETNYDSYYATPYSNPHHLMTFTMYRSNDEITIFHPSYKHDITDVSISSASGSFIQPRIIIINKNKFQSVYTDQSSFIQNGVGNYINIDTDLKKYFLFTYTGIMTGIKINPSVLKGMAASNSVAGSSLNYSDVVIKYRGQSVKLRYFDYGEFWMLFRWSALNNTNIIGEYTSFSYHIMFDDHPCTINPVG